MCCVIWLYLFKISVVNLKSYIICAFKIQCSRSQGRNHLKTGNCFALLAKIHKPGGRATGTRLKRKTDELYIFQSISLTSVLILPFENISCDCQVDAVQKLRLSRTF